MSGPDGTYEDVIGQADLTGVVGLDVVENGTEVEVGEVRERFAERIEGARNLNEDIGILIDTLVSGSFNESLGSSFEQYLKKEVPESKKMNQFLLANQKNHSILMKVLMSGGLFCKANNADITKLYAIYDQVISALLFTIEGMNNERFCAVIALLYEAFPSVEKMIAGFREDPYANVAAFSVNMAYGIDAAVRPDQSQCDMTWKDELYYAIRADVCGNEYEVTRSNAWLCRTVRKAA